MNRIIIKDIGWCTSGHKKCKGDTAYTAKNDAAVVKWHYCPAHNHISVLHLKKYHKDSDPTKVASVMLTLSNFKKKHKSTLQAFATSPRVSGFLKRRKKNKARLVSTGKAGDQWVLENSNKGLPSDSGPNIGAIRNIARLDNHASLEREDNVGGEGAYGHSDYLYALHGAYVHNHKECHGKHDVHRGPELANKELHVCHSKKKAYLVSTNREEQTKIGVPVQQHQLGMDVYSKIANSVPRGYTVLSHHDLKVKEHPRLKNNFNSNISAVAEEGKHGGKNIYSAPSDAFRNHVKRIAGRSLFAIDRGPRSGAPIHSLSGMQPPHESCCQPDPNEKAYTMSGAEHHAKFGKLLHGSHKTKVRTINPTKLQKTDDGWYGTGYYTTTQHHKRYATEFGNQISTHRLAPESKVLLAHIHPTGATTALKDAMSTHFKETDSPFAKTEHMWKHKGGTQGEWVGAVNAFANHHGYHAIHWSRSPIPEFAQTYDHTSHDEDDPPEVLVKRLGGIKNPKSFDPKAKSSNNIMFPGGKHAHEGKPWFSKNETKTEVYKVQHNSPAHRQDIMNSHLSGHTGGLSSDVYVSDKKRAYNNDSDFFNHDTEVNNVLGMKVKKGDKILKVHHDIENNPDELINDVTGNAKLGAMYKHPEEHATEYYKDYHERQYGEYKSEKLRSIVGKMFHSKVKAYASKHGYNFVEVQHPNGNKVYTPVNSPGNWTGRMTKKVKIAESKSEPYLQLLEGKVPLRTHVTSNIGGLDNPSLLADATKAPMKPILHDAYAKDHSGCHNKHDVYSHSSVYGAQVHVCHAKKTAYVTNFAYTGARHDGAQDSLHNPEINKLVARVVPSSYEVRSHFPLHSSDVGGIKSVQHNAEHVKGQNVFSTAGSQIKAHVKAQFPSETIYKKPKPNTKPTLHSLRDTKSIEGCCDADKHEHEYTMTGEEHQKKFGVLLHGADGKASDYGTRGKSARIRTVDPRKLQSKDPGFYGSGFYTTTSKHKKYAQAYGDTISKSTLAPDSKVLMAHTHPLGTHPKLRQAIRKHMDNITGTEHDPQLSHDWEKTSYQSSEWVDAVNSFANHHGYHAIHWDRTGLPNYAVPHNVSTDAGIAPEVVVKRLGGLRNPKAFNSAKPANPVATSGAHPHEGKPWFEKASETKEVHPHVDKDIVVSRGLTYADKEHANTSSAGWTEPIKIKRGSKIMHVHHDIEDNHEDLINSIAGNKQLANMYKSPDNYTTPGFKKRYDFEKQQRPNMKPLKDLAKSEFNLKAEKYAKANNYNFMATHKEDGKVVYTHLGED